MPGRSPSRSRRTILKEASVSAVVRFTWRNPDTGRRERGVFKVLKPHIPKYFAEDMDYLQGLAQYFGDRHHSYGFPAHFIPDTFRKVRRLLRHEVNFTREQKTLLEAADSLSLFSGRSRPAPDPALVHPDHHRTHRGAWNQSDKRGRSPAGLRVGARWPSNSLRP